MTHKLSNTFAINSSKNITYQPLCNSASKEIHRAKSCITKENVPNVKVLQLKIKQNKYEQISEDKEHKEKQ
jgi:hypothetical protein